jgi:glutathione S-transferase
MRQSLSRLKLTVERMEPAFEDGRSYLLGDFSLADICILPTFLRMKDIGLQPLWADYPGVSRWFDAASSRPSVGVAMYHGSLLSEKYGESVDVDLDRYFG